MNRAVGGAIQNEGLLQKCSANGMFGPIQEESLLQKSCVAHVVGGAIQDEGQLQECCVEHDVAHGHATFHSPGKPSATALDSCANLHQFVQSSFFTSGIFISLILTCRPCWFKAS